MKSFYLVLFLSTQSFASEICAKIALSPAGSFEAITQTVEGKVKKTSDTYSAEKITLQTNSLKTGVELRDEHMQKKYLEAEQFPAITLTNAVGKDGKFQAELEVRGIKKKVEGTYVADGKIFKPKFSVKMSDFSIPKAKYMGVGAKDEVEIKGELETAP